MCEGSPAEVTGAPAYDANAGWRQAVVPLIRLPGDAHFSVWDKSMTPALGAWSGGTQDGALVVCMDATDVVVTGQCQVKDRSLPLQSAKLKVTVFETKTGKKLGESTVEHADKRCPDHKGDARGPGFRDLSMTIARAVSKYQPPAAKPFFDLPAMGAACNGEAIYGATPYDPKKGAANAFVVFMREREYDAKDPSDAFLPIKDDFPFVNETWAARKKLGSEASPPTVSLVVCMEATRGAKARDCSYGVTDKAHPELNFAIGGPVALHQGVWTVRAVDPASGKVVKELHAPGQAVCPERARIFVRGDAYTALPGRALAGPLGGVIEPR